MSLEHKMPKLNPALFEPLKRIGKSSAVRAGLRARINKVISSFLRRATNRSGGKVKAPSFRQAFIKRRCRIPADGFYEWRKEPKREGGVEQGRCFVYCQNHVLFDRFHPIDTPLVVGK
jgi:putative SOS response-associated peptidase YedK